MTDDNVPGNAGYAIIGSGGGGTDGNYVFASLDELDDIIAEWEAIRKAIDSDRHGMTQAGLLRLRPAEDEMSEQQAFAVSNTFAEAIAHNEAMSRYTESYIAKLAATRKTYADQDADAAARTDRVDET